MAETVSSLKFYLPENSEPVPLEPGDVLVYDEGVGFVVRNGHTLAVEPDGEKTEFDMHDISHKSLVHFALDLGEAHKLSPRLRTPILGGEKEWVFEKTGS